jgi:hypothetical protein
MRVRTDIREISLIGVKMLGSESDRACMAEAIERAHPREWNAWFMVGNRPWPAAAEAIAPVTSKQRNG